MRHQSIWRIPLCIMICISFVVSIAPAQHSYAFSDQIIQRGATGDDVIELQARLQYNGFYHGPINGVFGWSTYWSVRNFQKEFGLEEVDGFVGQKTKDMLTRATKYYKAFVYKQIEQGNRFTHYGGMPLAKQSAPSPQVIEQAKKAAEQKRATQLNAHKQNVQKGNQQAQQPAKQQGNQKAQQPAKQQGNQKAQQPAKQQGNQQAQQPAEQQGNQQAQQPAEQQGNQQAQPPAEQQGNQQAQPPAEQQGNQQAEQPEEQAAPQEEQAEQPAPKETAVNMPNGFSQNDIQLMANAVYGEARGEPYIGQVAVAAVILNRVNSPTFPNTVSGVIFEPRAFTAVADGQIWLTPNEQAKKAVLDAINGFDPTGEAMYYFNPDTATSGWIWGRPQIKRIGKHIFCK
ncbi:N-acetylmuramoyl-L-alanine amidase [Bacillus mesophilus]|nr:cell wall hydrolase [Bacillus mesophilus]MBM7661222.1 N-acetylmuramoyl-L-alanine amidase [Bacillus mesophilus]